MAKPIRQYGEWRIRRVGENGKRQGEIYDEKKGAAYEAARARASRRGGEAGPPLADAAEEGYLRAACRSQLLKPELVPADRYSRRAGPAPPQEHDPPPCSSPATTSTRRRDTYVR